MSTRIVSSGLRPRFLRGARLLGPLRLAPGAVLSTHLLQSQMVKDKMINSPILMFYHWRIFRLLPQVMKPEEDYDGLFGEGSLGKLQERL